MWKRHVNVTLTPYKFMTIAVVMSEKAENSQ